MLLPTSLHHSNTKGSHNRSLSSHRSLRSHCLQLSHRLHPSPSRYTVIFPRVCVYALSQYEFLFAK